MGNLLNKKKGESWINAQDHLTCLFHISQWTGIKMCYFIKCLLIYLSDHMNLQIPVWPLSWPVHHSDPFLVPSMISHLVAEWLGAFSFLKMESSGWRGLHHCFHMSYIRTLYTCVLKVLLWANNVAFTVLMRTITLSPPNMTLDLGHCLGIILSFYQWTNYFHLIHTYSFSTIYLKHPLVH